ncbi:unnamed protein product [Mytilus coruscus]|uniref:Uncharacterized protein n=1 Tax=Mytilus coruscus TaxID=42192 RepID=A0A6J8EQF2_MYTCO|nr:unnamed protein product [Mytilus coruscus]
MAFCLLKPIVIHYFPGTASSTTPSQSLNAVELPEKGSRTTFHKDEASATTSSQSVIATKTMERDSSASFDIDGEYDRLNGVSKRRTDSKTNLYDSHAGICNESDPTYDSSNHGRRKLQFDNDVYDHTDTLSTDGSDYRYSLTLKSEIRNEHDVYDKAV